MRGAALKKAVMSRKTAGGSKPQSKGKSGQSEPPKKTGNETMDKLNAKLTELQEVLEEVSE